MALRFFFATPLINPGTVIGQPSFFTGDGSASAFDVVNDTIENVANTVQFSNTQLFFNDGQFTKDTLNDQVDLSQVPPVGVQGIIPTSNAWVFSSFDQDVVAGLSGSNIDTENLWLGDVDEIDIYGYLPLGTNPGIKIIINDAITNIGGNISMLQLACCDNSGNPLTYAATGVPIYTPRLDAFGLIAATTNNTTFVCYTASAFIPGDMVFLSKGKSWQEITRVTSISGNNMTFSPAFNMPHYVGNTVYACARQFSGLETMPIGYTGGTAKNYLNLYLQADAVQYQRF